MKKTMALIGVGASAVSVLFARFGAGGSSPNYINNLLE